MTDTRRIGFLGTGWIGRHRMAAMLADGRVEAVAIADPSPEMAAEAQRLAPAAALVTTLDEILALAPDGVVIATPSGLHAAQSIQALEAGAAVFCQKPLGRSGDEAAAVVAAARAADRLLGVDLSYRFTTGMQRIAALARDGELGEVHSVDLVFHNAYGPDKPWFYDRAQSGGGCVMDLGVHLVDLALWTLGFPEVREVRSHLTAGGRPLSSGGIEDFAVAEIVLATGTVIRLACSWRAHAGRDADIAAQFYGTAGGAALRNVGGSFYDFTADRYRGTAAEPLSAPPEEWGGRAAVDWARRLADGQCFDPAADHLVTVSRVLDSIYAG
jgi:predicted dehydrogenase